MNPEGEKQKGGTRRTTCENHMEGCSTSLEPDGRKHCPWTLYRVLLITDDKSFTECKQESEHHHRQSCAGTTGPRAGGH